MCIRIRGKCGVERVYVASVADQNHIDVVCVSVILVYSVQSELMKEKGENTVGNGRCDSRITCTIAKDIRIVLIFRKN